MAAFRYIFIIQADLLLCPISDFNLIFNCVHRFESIPYGVYCGYLHVCLPVFGRQITDIPVLLFNADDDPIAPTSCYQFARKQLGKFEQCTSSALHILVFFFAVFK